MSRNFKNLARQLVYDAFRDGVSKQAMRSDNPQQAEKMIFSYSSKFQLLDRIKDFSKYVPRNIKPNEVTKRDVLNFLEAKADTCRQTTLNEYRSEFRKLGKIWGVDLDVPKVATRTDKVSQRGAKAVISKQDFEKICNYATQNPSRSGVCILLESYIGVRVGDLCYGIKIVDDKLYIKSKNGKYCIRSITPQIRSILESETFKSMITADNKVLAPKDNSVNKYLARTEDRLSIERHSVHDIRRRIAQDKYDDFRNTGMNRIEALQNVSLWLNHGKYREDMMLRHYVGNAW